MSLYGDYIKERLGKEILETEDGFATYYFPNPDTCYLEDIYVRPEARRTGLASKMADQVVQIAKENRCQTLVGSVSAQAFGSTESMKALLAYGFELCGLQGELIYFKKHIGS